MSSLTPQSLCGSSVIASPVWSGQSEEGRGRLSRRDSPEKRSKVESTVLVVNDAPDSLELMRLLLSRAGYRVLTAFDGQEGYEVARRERPCLVVSDVSMPRVDGIELCRLMREHAGLRDTPVLLVSAIRKDSESVVEGLKAGADDYLEAPYAPTLLLAKVAQLIERVETEDALRESQARLAGIVESAMDAIITVDGEQRILLFNRAAEQMFRCTAADALGHPLDRFIPERFRAAHASQIHAFGRSEVSSRVMAGARAVSALRADGEEFPVEASISQVEAGGQKLYTVIMRDITERRRAEEELRESEQRLHTVIENLAEGLIISEPDGRLLYWNRAGLEIHGFSDLEEGLRHLPEFENIYELSTMDGAVLSLDDWPMARVLRGERLRGFDARVRHKESGWERVFSYNGSVVREKGGGHLAFLSIRDITERKQAEEQIRRLNETLELRVRERTAQLEAANKELEAFSYSVSHDLRAPLRHIDGFSRALLEDCADDLDEAGKGYLREVRAASGEMARLIEEVLQLARVTRGELRREEVSLSKLAREAVAELRKADAGREVSIRIEEGHTVRGDRRLLQVMLVNLLGNAWKFTSKMERAEIVFSRVEGVRGPVYFVRDNGAGFDMTYADKLFVAFQRLHSLDEFEGTGVGLATVQRVVNRHGGQVWAEGAVGRGATFYFTIPEFEGAKLEEQSDYAGGRQPEG